MFQCLIWRPIEFKRGSDSTPCLEIHLRSETSSAWRNVWLQPKTKQPAETGMAPAHKYGGKYPLWWMSGPPKSACSRCAEEADREHTSDCSRVASLFISPHELWSGFSAKPEGLGCCIGTPKGYNPYIESNVHPNMALVPMILTVAHIPRYTLLPKHWAGPAKRQDPGNCLQDSLNDNWAVQQPTLNLHVGHDQHAYIQPSSRLTKILL